MNAVPRPMHFIAAAKSMKRPIVGDLLKGSGAIPVERPQDIKK
jgi:glycerol-3-phosphate O-acyltransferase/dihydroxyacetone phosphate acyltransferase